MTASQTQGTAPARRRGCLRNALVGCLGVLLLAVAVPTVLVVLALVRGVPEPRPEQQQLTRPLPVEGQEPGTPGTSPPGVPAAAIGGRLILDLTMGSFSVVPGPPGQPIRVEADYDAGSFELVESYAPEGELGFTYELTFRSRIGWLRRLMGGIHAESNRVRLVVPRGVPLSVRGRIGVGESDLELGGLWITDADLRLGVGEHTVSFDEPGPVPMDSFRLSASVGEVRLERLGNASPARAELSQSLGEMGFDLSGAWRRDARVSVSCGIGECRVGLPGDEIRVDLERVSLTVGDQNVSSVDRRPPPPPGAPTLTLSVSGTLGELSVTD